jgi:hypothetical protein
MKPAIGEIWQHHKTKGDYEIVGIGKLQVKEVSLDMVECVVYKALSDGQLWTRPLVDFVEYTDDGAGGTVPRFSKIKGIT